MSKPHNYVLCLYCKPWINSLVSSDRTLAKGPVMILSHAARAAPSLTLEKHCTALTAPTFLFLPTPLLEDLPHLLLFKQRYSMGIFFYFFFFLQATEGTVPRDASMRPAAFPEETLLVEGVRKRFTDDDGAHLGTLLDNVTHVNGENGYWVLTGWQAWLVPHYSSKETCRISSVRQHYKWSKQFPSVIG